MAESEFTVRATQPSDAGALNDLYRRLTGIERTVAQWQWEWIDVPGGPAPSWVIVERASDRVVGHHGVVPVPLVHGARRLNAARTENTMIDPDARRRIVYPPIEARLLTELLQRFDLIFTTSGKGAHGLVRKRLGYRSAGQWRTFTIAMTPSYIAQRLAGAALGRLLSPLGAAIHRGKAGWTIDETADAAQIAGHCARWNADCIGPDRTTAHLRWRLNDHPYHRFRLGLLRRNGEPAAFLAWRDADGPNGTREVQIEDLCAAGNDGATIDAAFDALAALYCTKPARITLRTLDNGRPLARMATTRAARYRRAEPSDSAELLVRSDQHLDALPWDATMLLAEGI